MAKRTVLPVTSPPAVHSTILPKGDRLLVLDGGLEGAPGPQPSGGGVTPWMTSFGPMDSMWNAAPVSFGSWRYPGAPSSHIPV